MYKCGPRKFQRSWLEKHKWLVYLPSKNALVCKYCVVFGRSNYGDKHLVTTPFNGWKHATELFSEHLKKKSIHATNAEKAEAFIANIKSKSLLLNRFLIHLNFYN